MFMRKLSLSWKRSNAKNLAASAAVDITGHYGSDLTGVETLKYTFVDKNFPPTRSFVTIREINGYTYQNIFKIYLPIFMY